MVVPIRDAQWWGLMLGASPVPDMSSVFQQGRAIIYGFKKKALMLSLRKLSPPPHCRVTTGKPLMASPCSSPIFRNAVMYLWVSVHMCTHRDVCACASRASEECRYLRWWMVVGVCVLVQLFTVFRMGQQQALAWRSQLRGMAGTGSQAHGVDPALDVAASRVVQ